CDAKILNVRMRKIQTCSKAVFVSRNKVNVGDKRIGKRIPLVCFILNRRIIKHAQIAQIPGSERGAKIRKQVALVYENGVRDCFWPVFEYVRTVQVKVVVTRTVPNRQLVPGVNSIGINIYLANAVLLKRGSTHGVIFAVGM